MMDNRTGTMMPIPSDIPDLRGMDALADVLRSEKDIRAAMAATIPQADQGAILSVGEIIEIKGSRFKVHAITAKRIYLDCIASP